MKFRFRAKQGEPVFIVGRVKDPNGNYIKQGLTTSITAYCYDLTNGNAVVSGFPITLSIPAVIFDSLQQGPLWQDNLGRAIDSLGYNFAWLSPQNMLPNYSAGQSYRVEFEFVTSGLKWTGECQIDVDQVLTAPLP